MSLRYLRGYGPEEALPTKERRIKLAERLMNRGFVRVMTANIQHGQDSADAVSKEVHSKPLNPQDGVVGPLVYIIEPKVGADGQEEPGEYFAPRGAALWRKEEQQ